MTDDELQKIRVRCDAATPGPWTVDSDDSGSSVDAIGHEVCSLDYRHSPRDEANAHFIAICRTAVPALLAAIEESLTEIVKLRYEREQKRAATQICRGNIHVMPISGRNRELCQCRRTEER